MKQHLSLILNLFLLQGSYLLGYGDDFIRSNGIHFTHNGALFYINGFNAYWLMYEASDLYQRPKISATYRQAIGCGLNVARTWAFSDGGNKPLQIRPGLYNEQMFKGLDYVVDEARRYGIKLILSLVNNYEDYGGRPQYVNWARHQNQPLTSDDEFFTNNLTKLFFKNHINAVLNRRNSINGVVYKNDPTIMAWELMNEPRCPSDSSGTVLQKWIQEMASYVKQIDRNHLLEVGLEGFYGPSSPWRIGINPGYNGGADFIANNLIENIDFATIHSYPDIWLSNLGEVQRRAFLNKWLNAHFEDAQKTFRKPLLVAEFGKSSKDSKFEPRQRLELFHLVYSRICKYASGGGAAAGALFWQLLADGMDSFQDGYGIVLDRDQSTTTLIAHQSRSLNRIQKMFSRMMRFRARAQAGARENP